MSSTKKTTCLEFEGDVQALYDKIEALKAEDNAEGASIANEIHALETKAKDRLKKLYANLTPWEMCLVARHPQRPYTLDYVEHCFTDFYELHGDRGFADDPAIVGGIARLADMNVVVIGHQKGRDLKERTYRNFGMARPEGYRKALRLMRMAEHFNLPVITFIDTPGAYPGIGAEERCQSEAIGRNIMEMSQLKVPTIAVVIGEGGSGGALAIGVADKVVMLEYSTYSVISPEGCASILFKDAKLAPKAADALGLTAQALKKQGLVDFILSEPIGGAHRDLPLMAMNLKRFLTEELRSLLKVDPTKRLEARLNRFRAYGAWCEKAQG